MSCDIILCICQSEILVILSSHFMVTYSSLMNDANELLNCDEKEGIYVTEWCSSLAKGSDGIILEINFYLYSFTNLKI